MLTFSKMHGIGNDYIYINCFKETVTDPEKLSVFLSDVRFGVGSDGLVLILPSEVADFRMRIFNADGSEAMMCGNATRCIGKYVYDMGMTDKTEISLEPNSGIKYLPLYPVCTRQDIARCRNAKKRPQKNCNACYCRPFYLFFLPCLQHLFPDGIQYNRKAI